MYYYRFFVGMSRALIAGIVAASMFVPAIASGQGCDPGNRGGGGGGQPAPRREAPSSPPARPADPAPRRDVSPSPTPRRDVSPSPLPRREDIAPRRDPFSRRDAPAPRRDVSPFPRREDFGSNRDIAPYPRREDTAPRRDPFSRRDDPTPRRDVSPYPRRDDTAPRRDPFPRREESQNPLLGSGSERRGPGDIFDRRNPGRDNPPFGRSDTRDQRTSPYLRRDQAPFGSREPFGSQSRVYDPSPQRNRAYDIFTRSQEGRIYRHGITLRPGTYVTNFHIRRYFPHRYVYYPYYCPTYDVAIAYYSPYSFYFGVFPSYIYRRHCYYRPPARVYVEFPIYINGYARGYDDDKDDYYLSRRSYDDYYRREAGLEPAIDDLRAAFRYGNIELLVNLTDPNVRIAIFRRGKYEYSLNTNDYLDMTRDAMRAIDTIQFDLYRIRQRAEGVYVVSGKHVYRNPEGERRTVYVSFVLERLSGRWVITQVGTAPDRIQEW